MVGDQQTKCEPELKMHVPRDAEDAVVERVEAERAGGEERVEAVLDELVASGSLLTESARMGSSALHPHT